MAKDYEAAFEDVMSYIGTDGRKVDSQRKLEQFIRGYDRRNVMSDQFIEKIASTKAARELIKEPGQQAEVVKRGRINKLRVQRQRTFVVRQGLTPSGTYTTKTKQERFITFKNKAGKPVYFDDKGKIRDINGRYAKR